MDYKDILGDIVDGLKEDIGEDLSSTRAFVEDQAKLAAKQAEMIAVSRVSGSLKDDDELFKYFMDQLVESARQVAISVAMHTIVTIEKAWNAVANALWGALRTVLGGAGVPNDLLPETPPFSA